MQRACMQRARQQRQHRLRLLLVGQAHAHGLDASAEVSCAMARSDLQAERPLMLSTSRPVGEGCSRCAHAPNRVSRRSQSRAVSACRCAARQSRYRLLSRRRVEFCSPAGRAGSSHGSRAPATRRPYY
jgi:hypothetical protein